MMISCIKAGLKPSALTAMALAASLAFLSGCSVDSGPDAISSRTVPTPGDVSSYGCAACHLSPDNPSLNPITTGGTGTDGKHVIHYSTKGIGCEECHLGYFESSTHFNGKFDTGDPAVSMVGFDALSPTGRWTNDTGPQTGSCTSVACHGPDTMDWYGTAPWTMPSCEACHQSPEYPGIDPLDTNASGTAGKHAVHYSTKGIACEDCHVDYSSAATHMNGTLDTGDPAVALVQFDGLNASGQWTGDTGPQTGSCSSVACHGPDTIDWYGTAQWNPPACEVCHQSPGSPGIDPLNTNASGTAGKHAIHYSTKGIGCEDCHLGYFPTATHMNGSLDTEDATVSMVGFNALSPSGMWLNDTGPQTGSCASISCHGPDTMDWYGTAPWMMPACETCHLSADYPGIDPLDTNASGTAGKHAVHYSTKGIGCEECHLGYSGAGNHLDGTLNTPDPSAMLVSFDASHPAGQWLYDTGPQTGSCASISCHGLDTMDWYGTAPWSPPSCEVCHQSPEYPGIDPLNTNASGTSGKHGIHYGTKGIACEDCHLGYLSSYTHMNGSMNTDDPFVLLVFFNTLNAAGQWLNDTGVQTGSCSSVACHGPDTMDWYGTAPWSLPSCEACHQSPDYPAIDPLLTSGSGTAGKHTAHYDTWGIGCEQCHSGYSSSNTHMNGSLDTGDPAAALVLFGGVNASGQWAGDTGPQSGSCSSVACHGSDTVDWYGTAPWNPPVCEACHLWSAYTAINPILTGGSGTAGKHSAHYGTWSFACGKCHQGYSSTSTHANGILDASNPAVDMVFFDATNPAGAWTGDTGPQLGQCANMDCHGADTVEWYGTDGWTLPACLACHSAPRGSRRTITGPEGDFAENPSIASHHVAGAADPFDAQCAVCHDQSHHMSGTVRLIDADTADVVAYDPSNPSDLEPFCLSCHDADGAWGDMSPFDDFQTLGVAPYRMSTEIKTRWNKTYGHRRLDPGVALTCLGTGEPGTGCHAGGHGSTHAGILARRLALPNPDPGPYEVGDEVNYELCFSCHDYYAFVPKLTKEAILGVRWGGNYDWDHDWVRNGVGINPPYDLPDGIMTLFRDKNDQGTGYFYDDSAYFPYFLNLHYLHLEDPDYWKYRGVYDSGVSCIACHDMHGSNTPWGWVYDEMQLQHYQGEGNDEYGVMGYALPETLDNHPFNCAVNCHRYMISHMWFEPPNE